MRLSVALLRNTEAEQRAREKAEAPTVKTKEQIEKEEQHKAKYGSTAKDSTKRYMGISVWKRQFKPLPEAKAVDLFADVIGDGFILMVATVLIIYETWRSSSKPDANKEKIEALTQRFEELQKREEAHEEEEKRQRSRILQLEEVLRNYKDPKTRQPLLPSSTPAVA